MHHPPAYLVTTMATDYSTMLHVDASLATMTMAPYSVPNAPTTAIPVLVLTHPHALPVLLLPIAHSQQGAVHVIVATMMMVRLSLVCHAHILARHVHCRLLCVHPVIVVPIVHS